MIIKRKTNQLSPNERAINPGESFPQVMLGDHALIQCVFECLLADFTAVRVGASLEGNGSGLVARNIAVGHPDMKNGIAVTAE